MILLDNVNHMQKASGYTAALSLDQVNWQEGMSLFRETGEQWCVETKDLSFGCTFTSIKKKTLSFSHLQAPPVLCLPILCTKNSILNDNILLWGHCIFTTNNRMCTVFIPYFKMKAQSHREGHASSKVEWAVRILVESWSEKPLKTRIPWS